jgi:glucose/arabinose dehydrogenase
MTNDILRALARSLERRRKVGLCASIGWLALCTGCSNDQDSIVFTNKAAGGSGGQAANSGATQSQSAPDAGTSTGMDAGADAGRNVFRPEEVAATAERIAGLSAPPGFAINVFASGLGHARMLATRGEHVYLTRPLLGDVLRLTDTDGDGDADEQTSVSSGLELVHGITFQDATVYLATPTQVFRATVDQAGAFSAPSPIIMDLPDGGQHPYRTLGIGPDGALYISIGSSCDACAESNAEHATILRASLDSANRSVFARGLRNTIGFGWHPETNVLWGMDHGSDWRGDDLPPEELNRIEAGSDYGWPYCYGARVPDPVIQDPPNTSKAAYCATTTAPVLETQAHNAPIGLVFYTAANFPAEYRGNAFIALHGSWNRFPPTGYKVARVVFAGGEPQRFEDFVSGFLSNGGAQTFGRPAGIAQGPDGSLLFSDDANGVIYRVSHRAVGADAGTRTDAGNAG